MLDAIRLGPSNDATAVTATQLRQVVTRLVQAGAMSSRCSGNGVKKSDGMSSSQGERIRHRLSTDKRREQLLSVGAKLFSESP